MYKSNSLNTGDTYLLSILAFLHCTRLLHIINYAIINQIPVQLNRIKYKTNKHKKPCCMSDASGTKGNEAGFFPFAFRWVHNVKLWKLILWLKTILQAYMPSKEQHLKLITTHHTLTTIVQKFSNKKKNHNFFSSEI